MTEDNPATIRGQFDELTTEHCLELLGTTTVGRLGFIGRQSVEILPVNFVYRDGAIFLRTSPHGPLAALAAGVDGVAFEIDHHDDQLQSGWSVLITGRIEAIEDSGELIELWSSVRPAPWAAGVRTLFLRLDIGSITGRSVHRR